MGHINRLNLLIFLLVLVILFLFWRNGQKVVYFESGHSNHVINGEQSKIKSDVFQNTETKKLYNLLPGNSDENMLILYNRVPKTGSTSFMSIVYQLHDINKYNVAYVNVSSRGHRWQFLDQYRFALNITRWQIRKPGVFHGHFPFLNFIPMGLKQPLYINIIREPLERLVSHYYFLRYGDTYLPNKIRTKQGDKTTFDECVAQKKSECNTDRLWVQVPYFCGSDPECWKPGSKNALQRAKRNVINYYFLVGTTDRLDSFIEILEKSIPRIFKGSSKLFYGQNGEGVHIRKTRVKKPLREETEESFKASKVWKLEHDFYMFIRKRFDMVYHDYKTSMLWSYVKVKP